MNERSRDPAQRPYVEPTSKRRTRKSKRVTAKARLKPAKPLLRRGLETEGAVDLSPAAKSILYHPRCSLCGRDRVSPIGRLTEYEECRSCDELIRPLDGGHRFHPDL
jgi:hypothetical protein